MMLQGFGLKLQRLSAIFLLIVLVCALTGCANREKKNETIAVYNETAVLFNEVTDYINRNSQLTAEEIMDECVELSVTLKAYEKSLESDEILEEEEYDAMLTWLNNTKVWVEEAGKRLEEYDNE